MTKTIALAYSGGLDTSIIVPWLKEHYGGARIVCVAGDIGQGDELHHIQRLAVLIRPWLFGVERQERLGLQGAQERDR